MKDMFLVREYYSKVLEKYPSMSEEEKLITRVLLSTGFSTDISGFITSTTIEEIHSVYSLIRKAIPELWETTNQSNEPPNRTEENEYNQNNKKSRINRKAGTDYVVKNLLKNNRYLTINKVKYGRLYGTFLKDPITIKLAFSRDYGETAHSPISSWHKDNLTELTDDYYIFVVENKSVENDYRVVLFTQNEMIYLKNQKQVNGETYHFYFRFYENGDCFDERETTPINVTENEAVLNKKWKLF